MEWSLKNEEWFLVVLLFEHMNIGIPNKFLYKLPQKKNQNISTVLASKDETILFHNNSSLLQHLEYNVEKELFSVFKRIPKKIFKNKNIKVLIINDRSTDKTHNEIIKIKKKFKFPIFVHKSNKNLGYGGVQKFAFNYAIKKKI